MPNYDTVVKSGAATLGGFTGRPAGILSSSGKSRIAGTSHFGDFTRAKVSRSQLLNRQSVKEHENRYSRHRECLGSKNSLAQQSRLLSWLKPEVSGAEDSL